MDWLDRAALAAAQRLIDTPPDMLSPIGRELRDNAARDVMRRRTLKVVP